MPNAFLPSSKNKLYLLCIAGCLQDIQQGPSLGLRLPELEICSIFILRYLVGSSSWSYMIHKEYHLLKKKFRKGKDILSPRGWGGKLAKVSWGLQMNKHRTQELFLNPKLLRTWGVGGGGNNKHKTFLASENQAHKNPFLCISQNTPQSCVCWRDSSSLPQWDQHPSPTSCLQWALPGRVTAVWNCSEIQDR